MSEFEDRPFDNKTSVLRLGHLGSMELRRKNSHLFYYLAERMKNISKVKFIALGLITHSVYDFKNDFVEEIVGNQSDRLPAYLSREKYVSELKKLNYALFFYPKDEYIMRASGAISDVFDFLVPVIALEHPYFKYFDDNFGEIGYICKNLDEMEQVILDIIENPEKAAAKRKIHIENLRKIKQKSSVEAIAAFLKAMI
jgi:hypothetical protein